MRFALYLSIVILSSCGSKDSTLKFGKTTRADIIELKKAEPDREQKVDAGKDSSIMVYGDEIFQLEGTFAFTLIRNPKGDEVLLNYWKHKFKGCRTIELTLPHPADSHVPPEKQLSCDTEGTSIIYTQGSDAVRRVVEYEKK